MRERKYPGIGLATLVLVAILCTNAIAAEKIIYVDDDANGLSDGTSWQNAYVYLQDALFDANDSEKPVEIRVAQGIYKPDQGVHQTPGDPNTTFQLINDVILKGGYAGFAEPDPNARDIDLCQTILSGDLNDDDIPEDLTIEDIYSLLPSDLDNSKCVINASSTDRTSVLDGFTITGGFFISLEVARGGNSPADSGGGMVNVSSSPTVINCTFKRNRHAVYNHTGGNPVFISCKFLQNLTDDGGAILNIESNPEILDCVFENNIAWSGGAICLRGECTATLTGCTFLANQARREGGAIYSDGGNITINNCDFNSNRVVESVINGPGGAIFTSGGSTIFLEKCSFIRNETPAYGGGLYASSGALTLFGCKFYSNYAYCGGGGLYIGGNVLTSINNCTFELNTADLGSAVSTALKIEEYLTLNRCVLVGNRSLRTGSAVCGARRGSLQLIHCTLAGNFDNQGTSVADFDSYIVRNSIIWDQRAFVAGDRPNIDIAFSNIRNSWLEQSQDNIDVEPLFANPGYWADADDPNNIAEPNDPNVVWTNGDYHLKSQTGRWDPNSGSWVVDDVTSPCIDAGDPNSSVGDEPEPNGGRINMGAYGGTTEASKSPAN